MLSPTRISCFSTAATVALSLVLLTAAPTVAAKDKTRGDIREFSVGMAVKALPGEGYVAFACGRDGLPPSQAIGGWGDFAICPPDSKGLHEVAFQFDDSDIVFDKFEGTAVAGHPVLISLLFDDGGVVRGIRVVTDPEAPRYFRKGAHLLSAKVMARYGWRGWKCTHEPRAQGETPVGGMFKKDLCEKSVPGRRVVTRSDLYRAAGQEMNQSVNRGRLEIWQE